LTESLKQRIKTAIIIGVPILVLLFLNDTSRSIFLMLLIALTAFEYLSLYYKPLSQSLLKVCISLLATLGLTFLSYTQSIPFEALLVCSALVGLCYLIDLLVAPINLMRSLPWFNSILYTTLPLCTLLYFREATYFKELVIGCILLIWVSDIGAYFVGKSIGKHKLMPSISPGKTKEGFLGAGMCTLLVSYILFSTLGEFSFRVWALLGLSVWLFGSMGDLVESKIKRSLNIKDSSNILPGHGGFLDRFDGFYFCLPFVALVVYFIH